MINYKKSLLSVVTATAIMTSSLAADYLPLTTATEDYQWVSIGISGLKSDGTAEVPAVAGAFRITDADAENVLVDADATDLLPVSGMTRVKDLVKLDLLSGLSTEIRIDTSANTYLESDPTRTMYVKIAGTSTILFSVEYKATMEGQILEFSVNDGEAYETKLNYENIYANPASATKIAGTLYQAAVIGDKLESLTETDSLVDYDFSNNPPVSSEWTLIDHRDAIGVGATGSTLRMYSFNALERKWEIYDSRNDTGTNDFTTVQNAKGYWARLDNAAVNGVGPMLTTVTDKESGLVLGDPTLSTADYTAAGLAEGWNFIAFDGQNSQIRDAVSGVIATIPTTGTIALTDSSGNHTLSIPVTGLSGNIVVAKEINTAISAAILTGDMPKTFQVKAFPAGAIGGDDVAIISNRKFTIDDPADDSVTVVTTLAGKDTLLEPIGTATEGTLTGAITTLGTAASNGVDGAMSIYGEYAMVIEPLVGADTAQALVQASIQLDRSLDGGVDAKTDLAVGDITTTLAATALTANAAGVVPTVIDLDMAGAPAHILLAADEPFTIRDHTFTRVYELNLQGATDSLLTFSNGGDADIEAAADTAADVVSDINGGDTGAGATNLSAAVDTANKIIIVGRGDTESGYFVAETAADLIQVSTSSEDEARGAVKAVISLDQLVKVDGRNDITIDIDEITNAALESVTIDFTDTFGTATAGTPVVTADTYDATTATTADNIAVLNLIIAQLEADFLAAGITATVSDDYDRATLDAGAAAEFAATIITITGPDVAAATLNYTGAGEADVVGTPDLGYIASNYFGDLAVDLKFNNVESPNYTMDGPLYTMVDNNMSLRALVSGTTDLVSGAGEVTWESIDLTRPPSEWFDSQDYDLFETSANVGYWAYLTATTEANLSINSSTFPGTYKHHFDKNDGTGISTTTNFVSGTLTVDVDGITTAEQLKSARVTATFGGETVELTQAAAGGVFTGAIDTHEARSISTNEEIDIIINIADGLGSNATYTITDLFDNVKPQKPVISLAAGVYSVDANVTDTDVAQFYVFSGLPLESDTPAATVADADGTIPGTGGPITVACDGQAAALWNGSADGITVVAVDGTGVFGGGNASDASTVNMMRILLDRSLITATNTAGTWDSTSTAYDYNSSCATTGIVSTTDTGVTVSSLTDDETVKFAFATDGNVSNLELPVTVYVMNDDDGGVARVEAAVTYPASYAGTDAFIQLGDFVYGFQLPTQAALDTAPNAGLTSDNPLELDADYDVSNPKHADVQL